MEKIQISQLALDQLKPSPTNPRKFFDEKEIADLASSIADKGVLEPLLVRAWPEGKGGGFEIVAGERRFRASKKAKLEAAPCIIRVLTDQEVVEIQIVENMQRQDLTPLEEAMGYKMLHEKHGYSFDDLAAKIGKSKAYVYGRLNLLKLSPAVQKALNAGDLKPSYAVELTRVQDHEQQDQLLREIVEYNDIDSVLDLKKIIEKDHLLELKSAPFNTKDAELCPKAGACSTCPKRTGAQAGLFDDDKKDVCLDLKCWALKVETQNKRLVAKYKAEGKNVIEGEAAEKFSASSKGLLDLDEKNYDLKGYVTNREALRKANVEDKIEKTIVIDDEGQVKQYVERKALMTALPKKQLDNDGSSRDYGVKKPIKAARQKRLLELKATRAAWTPAWKLAISKVVPKELKGDTLRQLVKLLCRIAYSHDRDARGRTGKNAEDMLRSAKTDAQMREALWNLVMGIGLYEGQTAPTESTEAVFKLAGVSWSTLKNKAAAEIVAAKKAKAAAKGKPAAPAAAPKKKKK